MAGAIAPSRSEVSLKPLPQSMKLNARFLQVGSG